MWFGKVGGGSDMNKILSMFDPCYTDPVTIAELKRFAEKKYDEQAKLKAKIVRDLRRISDNAWQDPAAYDKLRAKYRAQWTGRKKIAILDMMKEKWAHEQVGEIV